MKYFQACNIYNDIRHNRQQKDDFDAAGSGGGGESDKKLTKTTILTVKAKLSRAA